jgi:hypothetical protein
MNQRIRELAEQAGATTMQRSGWIDYGTLDLDVEKFAELIVRECADVAVKFHLAHPYSVEYQVKKHFGVE